MTPVATVVQALVDALDSLQPLNEAQWQRRINAIEAGRALLAQETAASRATECEQEQPNTDSLHLALPSSEAP